MTFRFKYYIDSRIFSAKRARSTVHNWIHNADRQPETGQNPDQVAADETAIRLDVEQYWLYAAVNLRTNGSLHVKLEPTGTDTNCSRARLRASCETRRR